MRQRQDFVACDSGCTWYLVRHGETEWNRTRRIQGQTDTPLKRRGQTQASLLGRRLSDAEFSAVYASDLSRAMAAAAPVRPRRSGGGGLGGGDGGRTGNRSRVEAGGRRGRPPACRCTRYTPRGGSHTRRLGRGRRRATVPQRPPTRSRRRLRRAAGRCHAAHRSIPLPTFPRPRPARSLVARLRPRGRRVRWRRTPFPDRQVRIVTGLEQTPNTSRDWTTRRAIVPTHTGLRAGSGRLMESGHGHW